MKGVVMRVALIAMMIFLLPAALFAGPTMGIYFTYAPSQMEYYPTRFEEFAGYIYAHNTACFLDAVEFALEIPDGIVIMNYALPGGALTLGQLPSGLSVAYWPPMDGWNPGYNLLCTVDFLAFRSCFYAGKLDMVDAPLRVVAHEDTGLIRGSCWPENYLFEYAGLTSVICPVYMKTEDSNWSAIKSLF
jgi:hypothetical protein